MSDQVLWRVRALALPPLLSRCSACRRPAPLECAERFRVNAQGARLDVWLLYRCPHCAATHKRRLHRRRPVADFAPGELTAYERDDAALVRAHAFELTPREALPFEVVRPALPHEGSLRARIEMPEACGVRWDLLLARALGASRASIARAWRRGAIRVAPERSLAGHVADGDVLALGDDCGILPRRSRPV